MKNEKKNCTLAVVTLINFKKCTKVFLSFYLIINFYNVEYNFTIDQSILNQFNDAAERNRYVTRNTQLSRIKNSSSGDYDAVLKRD